MTKAATFVVVLFLPVCLLAQTVCPAGHSSDLICVVPGVYGPNGLVGDATNQGGPLVNTDASSTPHDVDFFSGASARLTQVTAEVGSQLSQLPLAAPASGVIFSFNAATGGIQETTTTLGPLLSDRAPTIGRHKLFLGVSYQYFDFDRADGTNLRSIPAVYNHETGGLGCTAGTPGCDSNGLLLFAHDTVTTQNRLDLKIHQITAVAVFGVTSRFDFSVAVPIERVGLSMTSNATINTFERVPTETAADAALDPNSCENSPLESPTGCMHQFSATKPVKGESGPYFVNALQGYNQATFSSSKSASGIGDVIFRGKFQAVKGEKAGLSVGLDFHAPTGSAEQFLGSGTWGVRPFAVFSYSGRIEPHASLGFQINGDSVLAVDPNTIASKGAWPAGAKGHLPNVLSFDAGWDAGITKQVTLSGDLIGQSFFGVQTLTQTTYTDFGGNVFPDIRGGKVTSNQLSFAAGGKFKLAGNLIVSANVLFRLNDAGLHYKPAPMIGLAYAF